MIHHSSPISGIAAYDDTYVATAGYDNQVILWDQATGQAITRGLHDHLANQCAFSPDGTLLVTSSSDYTTRLWSVPDMRLLALLNDQEDDVEMSVFHPSRELVATASRDHLLRVYDYSGAVVARFRGHQADVISVEWANDPDELITSSDDGTVKRWSLRTGDVVADIDLGGVETDTVVISQDGTLYAGNDNGEIVIIRGDSPELVPAHRSGIKRLVLDGERDLLVSLSYDRSMILWSTDRGRLELLDRAAIPADVWPRSCAFAAGSTIVFGTFGTTYRTYDYSLHSWLSTEVGPTPGYNAACIYEGGVLSVGDAGVVFHDGEELASMGSLCNFLTPCADIVLTGGQLGLVMDALTGKQVYQHRSPVNCGAAFVRGGVGHALVGTYTGEGLVFRLPGDGSVEFVTEISLHENAVKGVAVSDDFIVSVSADREIAWHDVHTFALLHRVPGAHDRIANDCASLGGGAFASVGRDLMLRIWSPDFEVRVIPTPHTHSIKSVAADNEGRFVATGSYDGHLAIYDRQRDEWSPSLRLTAAGISSLTHDVDRARFLASSYDGRVHDIPVGS